MDVDDAKHLNESFKKSCRCAAPVSDNGWLVLNGGPVENCILCLDSVGLGHLPDVWWR